jgi:Fur family ferric uptake transcriptional regulator
MEHHLHRQTKRRSTRQRQSILEELRRLPCHPTADELYLRVRQRLPNVSLGTVYRNLELLSSLGEARRLDDCGGQRRYDGDTSDHTHIHCVVCGAVGDLAVTAGASTMAAVRAATKYQVLDVRLTCIGVCPACQEAGTYTDAPEQERDPG